MKAKRILSALLTLLMLVSVLASMPMTANASDTTTGPMTLTYTNPAITVDVGTVIDLTKVSVSVDATTKLDAASITWTKDGDKITSFTPDAKGVTPLVATSGTTKKNVYVVAKNADEDEYVLYENDFDTATVDSLTKEGWVVLDNATVSVSDGQLHLGASAVTTSRMALPDWLGDFGDYAITMNASQTNLNNNDGSRWSAIMFHMTNNGSYNEWRHITVRANTSSNTVEFSGQYKGGWNYPYANEKNDLRKSVTGLDMTAGLHTLNLNLFGDTMSFSIDGEQHIYVEKMSVLKEENNNIYPGTTGLLGLYSNQGVLNVDSIKVTVMEQAPEEIASPSKLIDTSANRPESNITSYVSNQAYAKDEVAFNALINADKHPVAILLDVAADVTTAQFETYLKACAGKGIIPEFRLTTTAQVDAMSQAMTNTGIQDVLVVSTDADVVKYARALKPAAIRGAVEFTEKTMTEAERFAAYQKTVGANTQTIILPYELVTKENVAVLQNFQLAVWAFGTGIDTDTEYAWMLASGANAVISDNWTAMADAQKRIFTAENSLTRTPVYTAHRGYWAKAPENSMSAYIAAYESGVDCLETDVYITKDGRVVILHDGTLKRTTDAVGTDATTSVENMTLEQIQKYHLRMGAGNGTAVTDEVMPTFDDMLEYFKGKDVKIFCELKSYNAKLPPAVAALVKKYEMEDQVVFISFSDSQLRSIKKELNTAGNYLNISAAKATEPLDVLNGYYTMQSAALACNSVLGPSYGNINAEYIRDGGDRGMTYWTWTYTSGIRNLVNQMFLDGMNGLTTNDTPYLANAVKTISAPSTLYAEAGNKLSVPVYSTTYAHAKTNISDAVEIVALDGGNGVITVNDDGTITAKKNGTATVLASYKTILPNGAASYTLYTQPITIEVGTVDELTLNDKETYTLADGYLTGAVEKTSVSQLLAAIANAPKAKLLDLSGKEVTDPAALIGNGFKIEYNGKTTTIVVLGDLNGNGKIDTTDYMLLKRSVLGTYPLNAVRKLAADITGDGKITSVDYAMLKRHCLGTYNIYS